MASARVLSKMTAREIAKNFLQYLSMILISMLAVTLFCGFISNAKTLEKSIDDYKSLSNLADLTLQFNSSGISGEDKNFLSQMDDIDFEYRIYLEGTVNSQSAKIYVSKGEITKPHIVKGDNGVLIDKKFAERNELNIGDEIKIETSYINSSLKVTGFMNFIEVANTYTVCPVFISEDKLKSVLEEKGLPGSFISAFYSQVLIKTNDVAKTRKQIEDYFNAKENNNLLYILDSSSSEAIVSLESEVSQSLKMIYVFPVIFLLVSVLVILTTISQLILRERTNIGTLKAIGISNRQILLHYSLFGVILCLIGGVIGVIIGPQIVTRVMLIKYNLVYSLPSISYILYSPFYSILALLIVAGLAGLIGSCVSLSVIRERPSECMRPKAPRENILVKSIVNSSKNIDQKKENYHLSFKMALRNIVIKPSRAIMTIIGIAGCVALLVCSFGIGDTVNNSVNVELNKNYTYDVRSSYMSQNAQALLNELDRQKENGDIDNYETYKSYYVSAKSDVMKDIFVYEYQPSSKFVNFMGESKCVISKSLAEDLSIRKNDEITLTFGSNTVKVKIEKVVETAFTNGLFVTENILKDFQHTNHVFVKTTKADEIRDLINTLNGTSDAQTENDLRDFVQNKISSIDTIKLTLMFFAIALSVVVLYNLSLLNLNERNRDIATMKVLGFSNNQIGLSLLYEIMILTLLGTLFGLLLGYPILVLVMSINRVEVLNYIFKVNLLSYLFAFLISFVTALIINLIFMAKIRKINMITSLKSVE